MITDGKQVCFAKVSICGVQEGVLIFPRSYWSKGHFEAFTYKE